MSDLRISADWMGAASGDAEVAATAAMVGIDVDHVSLTRNQDVWAKTVRDNVFVSAYPLAMWFASSWWRLNHEPLPTQQPGHEWRMAHEIGAANHGFVWPRVILIPDGEAMHVWAGATTTPDQSVQYLQSLEAPKQILLNDFQRSVEHFVHSVLARLDASELPGTDLAQLWAILQEDRADPEAFRRRKLEAELGFDPEECPPRILEAALQWENKVGEAALSELAPAISSSGKSPDLATLGQLASAEGIVGAPQITAEAIKHLDHGAPWERAVHDARSLRLKLGNVKDPIPTAVLHQLLGLTSTAVKKSSLPEGRLPVAVAMPSSGGLLKFVPRKRNAVGQRFEFARFLGEYLRSSSNDGRWLASTDLGTFRQKYQRAFAAEFLCPLDALTTFLDGDFSSYAIEEAALKFEVSEQVVSNLLLNNGYIPNHWASNLPYQMAA